MVRDIRNELWKGLEGLRAFFDERPKPEDPFRVTSESIDSGEWAYFYYEVNLLLYTYEKDLIETIAKDDERSEQIVSELEDLSARFVSASQQLEQQSRSVADIAAKISQQRSINKAK
jgi:hypothetical protein